jgi:hypothetical protein
VARSRFHAARPLQAAAAVARDVARGIWAVGVVLRVAIATPGPDEPGREKLFWVRIVDGIIGAHSIKELCHASSMLPRFRGCVGRNTPRLSWPEPRSSAEYA